MSTKEDKELRKWAVEQVNDLSRGAVTVHKMDDIIKCADKLCKYVVDGEIPESGIVNLMEAKQK